MAYTSGTAANYKDLLAVMATFAAANGWVIKEQSTDKLYLMGTGLAGLDEIHVGIETYEDSVNGRYNWDMAGAWGWRAGRTLAMQPMSSGNELANIYLWNAAIPYWMVATPRRIIVVAKVSNTYQMAYLGLLTPPATDAQYPYPLLVAGTYYGKAYNYSNPSQNSFWNTGSYQCARISMPGGVWGSISSNASTASNPTVEAVSANFSSRNAMLTAPDGSYLMEQLYLAEKYNTSILGALEGLFRVSGYNNSAENIITAEGVNYMVFPDVAKSSYGDYCAMRLN